MATKRKKKEEVTDSSDTSIDDFSIELIKQLNKEHNANIAFNLSMGDAPTNIKRWIPTGSRGLDAILSNRVHGGLAEGRIVEIYGPPSCGKSTLCFQIAKHTQGLGGVVVYIDTENATNPQSLIEMGIDVEKRFAFVQTGCTEEVFAAAESAILKMRSMNKDVPLTIIWDSVANSSPRAELEGEYDQNTIGLQARVIGKGMRKITNIIANQNVLFVIVNQQRKMIGAGPYQKDTTTPGGMAIPYAASTRIEITSTGKAHIKDKDGTVIGIKVKAKTEKNKVAAPFRTAEFSIIYGVGIEEHEECFDMFKSACDTKGPATTESGKLVEVSGNGAWKTINISKADTGEVIEEIKCYKAEFGDKFMYLPQYAEEVDALIDHAFVMKSQAAPHPTLEGPDFTSYSNAQAVLMEAAERELKEEGKL